MEPAALQTSSAVLQNEDGQQRRFGRLRVAGETLERVRLQT